MIDILRDREFNILLTIPSVQCKRELSGNERLNVMQEPQAMHIVATTLTPQEFYRHRHAQNIDSFLENHNIHNNENQQVTMLVCGEVNILLSKSECIVIKDSANKYFFVLPGNQVMNITIPTLSDGSNEAFDAILNDNTALRIREQQNQRQVDQSQMHNEGLEALEAGDVLTSGTSSASWVEFITANLEKGSDWLAQKTEEGGEYLIKQIPPGAEPIRIDDKIQVTIKRARQYSDKGTEIVANTLKDVAGVALSVGDNVSTKLAESSDLYATGVEQAKEIAYSKLKSANQILQALSASVSKLMTTTTASATSLLEHRFGPEVGELSRNTLGIRASLLPAAILASTVTTLGETQQEELMEEAKRQQILVDLE